jgi:hypothetical protein
MSFFHCSGRAKLSVQVRGTCVFFVTMPVFTVRSCQHLAQPPSLRTTPSQLSATAYSIYSQAVPPSATRRRAMPHGMVRTWKLIYNRSVCPNAFTQPNFRCFPVLLVSPLEKCARPFAWDVLF